MQKLNSVSTTTNLTECFTALMLLSISAVDGTRRVSVLAAAARSSKSLNAPCTSDQFLGAIIYQSVSSVIRQCDQSSVAWENSYILKTSSSGTISRERALVVETTLQWSFCLKMWRVRSLEKKPQSRRLITATCQIVWLPSDEFYQKWSERVFAYFWPFVQRRNQRQKENCVLQHGLSSGILSIIEHKAAMRTIGWWQISILGHWTDELSLLTECAELQTNRKLDTISMALKGHTQWEVGTRKYASPVCRILDFTVLTATSDSENAVGVTQIVLDRSSRWVFGRNATRKASIEHLMRNFLTFTGEESTDYTSMVDSEFWSYIPFDCFISNRNTASTLSFFSAVTTENIPRRDTRKAIDKIHRNVCGYANLTVYKLLLEQNNLWNETIASYVFKTMEYCTACRCTSSSIPSRKVSISSLSKNFDGTVCVDHLNPDEVLMARYIDLTSGSFVACFASSTNVNGAVLGFEATWVGQFWCPESIQADKFFQHGDFKTYVDKLGIAIRPLPPWWHSKNPIESKHNKIRTLYLRLKELAGQDFNPKLAAQKVVSILNDLYGINTKLAFELAKRFINPATSTPHKCMVSDDVSEALERKKACFKLTLILRSKAVQELPIAVADIVEVFHKKDHKKKAVGHCLNKLSRSTMMRDQSVFLERLEAKLP